MDIGDRRLVIGNNDNFLVYSNSNDVLVKSAISNDYIIVNYNKELIYSNCSSDSKKMYLLNCFERTYYLVRALSGLGFNVNSKESMLSLLNIDEGVLDELSYENNLGFSLNKDIRKADLSKIRDDVVNYIKVLIGKGSYLEKVEYRIKSLDSFNMKLNKYKEDSRKVKSVVNDILGMRGICNSYSEIPSELGENYRVVDMSKGKKNDDGYRGIHIYYQKNSKCYPIEIQFNTPYDRKVNDWLHSYAYKYHNSAIGVKLRYLCDTGKINSEEEFLEVLNNVLLSSKEI